jgi:hypothetical protein
MLARVAEVLRLVGTGRGDAGILTATNPQADKVMALLAAAEVPTVSLKNYAGKSSDMIRVGTIKRAKGLGFKRVLLPHVPAKLLANPRRPSPSQRRSGASSTGGSCTSG